MARPREAELAEAIRAERVRLGLTQAEIARRLGIIQQSYAQLEVWANPRYTRLRDLVLLVGMDPRALVPELFEARA